MKTRLTLCAGLLLLAPALLASTSTASIPSANPPPAPIALGDRPDLPGTWWTTHPGWSDMLTICRDGSFHRDGNGGDGGRWTTAKLQGRPMLVLAWDNWPAEAIPMTGPNTFRGKASDGSHCGEMVMRRCKIAADAPERPEPNR